MSKIQLELLLHSIHNRNSRGFNVMQHIKTFIFITILIILNACQGRNMPMQTTVSSNSIEHKSTSIPQIQKPAKTIHMLISKKNKTKNIQKYKHSKENKKAITHLPLVQSVHPKYTILHKKKVQSKHKLVPIPHIPSISESQILKVPKIQKKIPTKPTEMLVDTMINTQVAQPKESFSGGGIVSGLDMATIRIGKSSDYTSIIFDSYQYEGKQDLPTKKASSSGTYLFTYEPSKKRIIGLIDGYKAFSALLSDQRELFKDNTIVENIYVLKQLGNDGIKFIIKLRKNVRVNIFDVKNPGRIIVNLFPL